MFQSRLVRLTASLTRQPLRAVERSIRAFLDLVRSQLAKGQKVTLSGFGTFRVRSRKSRVVRNPQTGKLMMIPPRKAVRFIASSRLRRVIR